MTTPASFSSFYNRDSIKNPSNVRVGDIGLGVQASPEKDFGQNNSKPHAVRKSDVTYSRVNARNDPEDNRFSKKDPLVEEKKKGEAPPIVQQPKEGKCTTTKIVLIVLGILALSALAAAGFYFLYYKKYIHPDIVLPTGEGFDQATGHSVNILERLQNVFSRHFFAYESGSKGQGHHLVRYLS